MNSIFLLFQEERTFMMYKSWKTFVILAFTLFCLRTAIMKTTHLINSFFSTVVRYTCQALKIGRIFYWKLVISAVINPTLP